MWWLLAALAGASPVEVVTPDGPIVAGVPAVVWVAAVGPDGGVPTRAPTVEVSAGSIRYSAAPAPPNVWSYLLEPPPDVGDLAFTIRALGEVHEVALPVRAPAASALVLPRRIDAVAGGDEIRFLVTGDDLPPPEALHVAVAEGEVLGVERGEGGLVVRLRPGESRFPRYVPVLVRDARGGGRPVETGLRIRTRPRIALQTEPGTTLGLTVGKRSYGPFRADAEGIATAVVDQYPGEMVADAVLTDDLGNQTTTSLPLSSQAQASLVALSSGPRIPGRPAPVVYLRGIHGDGHDWQGAAPRCRSTGHGELVSLAIGPGLWMAPLPEDEGARGQDVRVVCSLGGAAEASLRVPVSQLVPARLRLSVWPEELSADFPFAEVRAVLEDLRGERLPTQGVQVTAIRGEVALERTDGFVAQGEYRGAAAVEAGHDELIARYDRPAGPGVPSWVEVTWGRIPASGDVEVYGRALDQEGLPIVGIDVALSAGGEPLYAVTGLDGWARAAVPLPERDGPVVFEARTLYHVAHSLGLRGSLGRGGPGTPDLEARRVLPVRTGRVANLQLVIDPPILFTGPGAVALVRVSLLDRSGNPITDESVQVEASSGVIGPLHVSSDGQYVAEYTPPPGDRVRDVTITARAEHSVSTSSRLLLEPRPLDRAVGFAGGAISNLSLMSAYGSVDMDWRTPWFGESVFLRVGASGYVNAGKVETGIGEPARVRYAMLPVTVGAVARNEMSRGRAVWLGLGGVIAPYRGIAWFGDEVADSGFGVVPPGVALMAGAGIRAGRGEIALEARGVALAGPGGPLAIQGPVGGIAGLLGYRILY